MMGKNSMGKQEIGSVCTKVLMNNWFGKGKQAERIKLRGRITVKCAPTFKFQSSLPLTAPSSTLLAIPFLRFYNS